MDIKQVREGKCSCCDKKAFRRIDGELFCGHCADNVLLKQIKRCIEGISGAVVSLKILPKQAVLREARRGKEKGI